MRSCGIAPSSAMFNPNTKQEVLSLSVILRECIMARCSATSIQQRFSKLQHQRFKRPWGDVKQKPRYARRRRCQCSGSYDPVQPRIAGRIAGVGCASGATGPFFQVSLSLSVSLSPSPPNTPCMESMTYSPQQHSLAVAAPRSASAPKPGHRSKKRTQPASARSIHPPVSRTSPPPILVRVWFGRSQPGRSWKKTPAVAFSRCRR